MQDSRNLIEKGDDMKKLAVVIGLVLLGVSASPAHFAYNGHVGVSFSAFYSSLSPYGEWIPIDEGYYGWRPVGVAAGWRPYMYGHWVWTDYGWYWATDEPWGWAVFHYGRWHYDDFYGWIWIPGYDWAPAWVEWRYGGSYVGWAPLGPYAVFDVGIGIHYAVRWRTPHSYWTFVDCQYVTHPTVHRYVYRTDNNTRYIGRTRYAGSVDVRGGDIITRGPDRQFVEGRGNTRIEQTKIVDVRERQAPMKSGQAERIVREGDGQRMEVYRPRIEARSEEMTQDRPERVRQSDRRVTLDTRSTDIGVRETVRRSPGEDQGGTEVRKREVPGVTREVPRTGDRDDRAVERRTTPEVSKPETSSERTGTVSRQRDEQRREEQKARTIERKTEQPREVTTQPRVQQEQKRSEAPERTIRRAETPRQERSVESQRGNEGTRKAPQTSGQRSGRDR